MLTREAAQSQDWAASFVAVQLTVAAETRKIIEQANKTRRKKKGRKKMFNIADVPYLVNALLAMIDGFVGLFNIGGIHLF